MARTRTRAAARKEQDRGAHMIGSGVYSVARDLGQHVREAPDEHGSYGRIRHVEARFPRPMLAPLVYMSEMIAATVARQRELPRERADELALYLFEGMQESIGALVESFDGEHFEAWVAAARLRGVL